MNSGADKLSHLVSAATGPAPWYWETFPSPTGASGKRYVWRFHPQGTDLAFLVTLHLADELDNLLVHESVLGYAQVHATTRQKE